MNTGGESQCTRGQQAAAFLLSKLQLTGCSENQKREMVTEQHVTLHCFNLYVSESSLGGSGREFSSTSSACLYSIRPHTGKNPLWLWWHIEEIKCGDYFWQSHQYSCSVLFTQSLCFFSGNAVTHSQANNSQEWSFFPEKNPVTLLNH